MLSKEVNQLSRSTGKEKRLRVKRHRGVVRALNKSGAKKAGLNVQSRSNNLITPGWDGRVTSK